MSTYPKARIKEILTNCCAGNASLATDILHEEFIIIDRASLPNVSVSKSNGFVTALAQEYYQPNLALRPSHGDIPGNWSREIAYANLAIAEAVDAKEKSKVTRRDELAVELSPLPGVTYGELSPAAQNAIDRIITMESK